MLLFFLDCPWLVVEWLWTLWKTWPLTLSGKLAWSLRACWLVQLETDDCAHAYWMIMCMCMVNFPIVSTTLKYIWHKYWCYFIFRLSYSLCLSTCKQRSVNGHNCCIHLPCSKWKHTFEWSVCVCVCVCERERERSHLPVLFSVRGRISTPL